MAVKIRLSRYGAKKRPYYRIVAADVRSPRNGDFIEQLGTLNPMVEKTDPARLILKEDRVKHWLSIGAKPTDRLEKMFGAMGFLKPSKKGEQTKKNLPKAKAQERLKAMDVAKAATLTSEPSSESQATASETQEA